MAVKFYLITALFVVICNTQSQTLLCPDNTSPKKDDNGRDIICNGNRQCPVGYACTQINLRTSRCCLSLAADTNTCPKPSYVSHGDPSLHAEFGRDWASAYMAVDGRRDVNHARVFAQRYAEVAELELLQEVAKKSYVQSVSEVFSDGVHPRTVFPKDISRSVMQGDFRRKASDGPASGIVDNIAKLLSDFNSSYTNVIEQQALLQRQFNKFFVNNGNDQASDSFDLEKFRTQVDEQVRFLRQQAVGNQFARDSGGIVQPDFACNGDECQTLGASHDPLRLDGNKSPCKEDVCLQSVRMNGQCTSSSCFSYISDEVPAIEDYDKLQWGVLDWRLRSMDGKSSGKFSFVTSVKDQNACGSCWDFATTAAFESAIARQYGLFLKSEWVTGSGNRYSTIDLSEQVVLDHANGGCGGSSCKDACDNVFEKHGGTPLSIEDYVSHGFNRTCIDSKSPCTIDGQVLKQTFASIPTTAYNPRTGGHAEYWNSGKPLSEGEIRTRLEKEGPFAVNVWANFGSYGGIGVYDNPSCAKNYTPNACNTSSHPEWCGADQGVNHVMLLVGYGSQLVNTCARYNSTRFCIFGNFFCFDIRDKCVEYKPQAVNFWIVKNSWSWRGWAYHNNVTLGNEGGGYIKLRSGQNLCNIEEYLFKPLPQAVEETGSISVDFPFGIHFEIPTFGLRDICFNKDNTATMNLAGTDYEVKFNQVDCYSYLCNYNRTGIEKNLVNPPGGAAGAQRIPNVGSMLPWYDRADFLGFESLGRDGANIRNAKLPGGWCEKNLNSPQGFCKTATPYCSYGSNANGHKQGDPVSPGDIDPNSVLQALRAIVGAIFGAEPYSKTATCQLWRDLCVNRFFWQSLLEVNKIKLLDITWPSKVASPKSLVEVFSALSPTPKPRPNIPSPVTISTCPTDVRKCPDGSTLSRDPITCAFLSSCPPACPSGGTPARNVDGVFMSCSLSSNTPASFQCPTGTSCQTTDQQTMCCPCPPCRQCPQGSTCQCGECISSPTPVPLRCTSGTPLIIEGEYLHCIDDSACDEGSACQWDSSNRERICCSCPSCPTCGPNANCVCGQCVAAPTPAFSCSNGDAPLSNADGNVRFCSTDRDCPTSSSCQLGRAPMLSFSLVAVPVNRGICCPCVPCRFECIRGQTCQCGQCVQAPTPSVVCADGRTPLADSIGGFMVCSSVFRQDSCPPNSRCERLTSGDSFCCACAPCQGCRVDQTCQCGQCVQAPTPAIMCPDNQQPVPGPNGGFQSCSPPSNLRLVRVSLPTCPDSTYCYQAGLQPICCPCPPCRFCARGTVCRCGECVPDLSPTQPAPTTLAPIRPSPTPSLRPPFSIRFDNNLRDIAQIVALVPTPAPFRLNSAITNLNLNVARFGRPTFEPPR